MCRIRELKELKRKHYGNATLKKGKLTGDETQLTTTRKLWRKTKMKNRKQAKVKSNVV